MANRQLATADFALPYKWICIHDSVDIAGDDALIPGWTARHAQQGFSLRRCSVAFSTPSFVSLLHAEVVLCDSPYAREGDIRAISVPLLCVGTELSVTSLAGDVEFHVDPGHYGVTFRIQGQSLEDLVNSPCSECNDRSAPHASYTSQAPVHYTAQIQLVKERIQLPIFLKVDEEIDMSSGLALEPAPII